MQGLFEQIETFSTYEVARKVPLFYMLNMMSTFLGGYFNRNEKSLDFLETFKDDFPERDRVILAFNSAAATFAKLKLPKESMWCQKANFFTLMTELAVAKGEKKGIRIADTRAKLSKFESSVPEDYLLAAREAVNNKRERTIRAKYVAKLIVQAK